MAIILNILSAVIWTVDCLLYATASRNYKKTKAKKDFIRCLIFSVISLIMALFYIYICFR